MRYILTRPNPISEKDILCCANSLDAARKEEKRRRENGQDVDIYMLSPIVSVLPDLQ